MRCFTSQSHAMKWSVQSGRFPIVGLDGEPVAGLEVIKPGEHEQAHLECALAGRRTFALDLPAAPVKPDDQAGELVRVVCHITLPTAD